MHKEYLVKEIILTLQGEGAQAGTAVVLLRFSGCNLNCDFCDTDFTGTDGDGGGTFKNPAALADAVQKKWIDTQSSVNVLCTGGEPLLQLDLPLLKEFHSRGFKVLLETNGTLPCPAQIDWVCVSPKSGQMPNQILGDEIKIVWPQENIDPKAFEQLDFTHFWIQPKHDLNYRANLRKAVDYCLVNPKWRLSLQTHRFIGIP